jgi:hypothetical protein
MEHAPDDLLPSIEQRIAELNLYNRPVRRPFTFPSLLPNLLKPSIAVFALILISVVSYTYMTKRAIGYVENLSERFKVSQFEKIRSGDILSSGDNTTVTIRLSGNTKLEILRNTIVQVKSARRILLARGEISLVSGNRELHIETPEGVLLARNVSTKIAVTEKDADNPLKTETTFIVFDGTMKIKSPPNEIIHQSEKVVLTADCRIVFRKDLTVAEAESEKVSPAKQKIFAAIEALCDCIYSFDFVPENRGDHLRLFGKEINEKKFKVRVFWPEKKPDEVVFGCFFREFIHDELLWCV